MLCKSAWQGVARELEAERRREVIARLFDAPVRDEVERSERDLAVVETERPRVVEDSPRDHGRVDPANDPARELGTIDRERANRELAVEGQRVRP